MKTSFFALLVAATVLSGCVSPGTANEKGNLDIRLTTPENGDVHLARVYVDGRFIGNVDKNLTSLDLWRGKHVVRVELAGMKTYEQEIVILGGRNHQYLDVRLEKKR